VEQTKVGCKQVKEFYIITPYKENGNHYLSLTYWKNSIISYDIKHMHYNGGQSSIWCAISLIMNSILLYRRLC